MRNGSIRAGCRLTQPRTDTLVTFTFGRWGSADIDQVGTRLLSRVQAAGSHHRCSVITRGGNIDSWLLSTLLRKAWFYWQPRVGDPEWNMQAAFRGHIIVLCDQENCLGR